MSKNNDFISKLKIIKDEPLFGEEYQKELDAFNHKAYTDTIYDLLVNNSPPLSIGLFGSWGIGKSSIIFALIERLKKTKGNILPIYFNAWKYSGDSFRREFLLTIAKDIISDKKEKEAAIKRIKHLYYENIKQDEIENKDIVEFIRELLTFNWKQAFSIFKINPTYTLITLIATIILLGISAYSIYKGNLFAFSSALFVTMLIFILTKGLPYVFEFKKTDIIDPRLIFPEQFEDEFEDLVKRRKENILFIIDDFDRCHADTIYDILTSIKTFLKTDNTKNCYFLVALDDKAVNEILKKNNNIYEYETLRKYFDVAVRVSPLGRGDLIDFANSAAKETGIPADIIQVGVLAKCNDARKIKHFINTFITKAKILKDRLPSDFDVEKNFNCLAKIIVIEELFPDIFEKIIREPHFINRLEDNIIQKTDDENVKKILTDNNDLREFLEATSNIRIEHPEIFALLKVSNLQSKITRGFELYDAILNNNKEVSRGVLSEISSNNEKETLIYMLKNDMLDKANMIFLKNTIVFCLDLLKDDFFDENQKSSLSIKLCPHLFRDNQNLQDYDIDMLFMVANFASTDWMKKLSDKLRDELKGFKGINPKLSQIINNCYRYNIFVEYPSKLYHEEFRQIIDTWIANKDSEEIFYNIIDTINVPDDNEIKLGQPLILHTDTIIKLINTIETTPDDAKSSINNLKRKIVIDRWDDSYIKPFSEKLNTIFTQYPSEKRYASKIQFLFESIIEMPAWLDKDLAQNIGNHAISFYQRCSEESGKTNAIKVILIAARSTNNSAGRNDLVQFAIQNTSTLSVSAIEAVDGFITEFEDKEVFIPFKEKMIKYLLDSVVNQRINNPDERIKAYFDYCVKNRTVIKDDSLKNIIKRMYQKDAALPFWKDTIIKSAPQVDNVFVVEVNEDVFRIIESANNLTYQNNCVELLKELLIIIPEENKNHLIAKFINLLINSNATIRQTAIQYVDDIKNISDINLFKTTLSNVVRHLCDKNPSEILTFQESLEATLKYKELWTDDEWEDLAKLIKWLLDLNNNENIHDYGRKLLPEFDRVPKNYVSDLTTSLIALATSSNSQTDRENSNRLLIDIKDKLEKKHVEKFLKNKEINDIENK